MKLCPICATSYPDGHRTCPTHGTLLVDSEELPAGTIIRDCYRIERVIGKGGMGTVYLAEHILLGEQRALKFLSTALAANPQFLQRFLQEARAASKLRHPNIAATLELGQAEGGSLYICMEYVDGPSLRSVLKASPQGLAPERALSIARGVAEGLGAAHAKGMVHRDVKPENILLGTVENAGTRAEIAKVVDFGIVAMNDSSSHLTQTGQQLLTAEYAAPEQWRGTPAASLDGRTDFYSLGCVLFEMLTGRQAFQSDTFEGWYQHHLYDPPPTASTLRPELARIRGIDALLAQLLSKEREHRPYDASAFVAMIDAVTGAMAGTRKLSAESPRPEYAQPTAALDRATLNRNIAQPPAPQWAHVPGPAPDVASVPRHSAPQPQPVYSQPGPPQGSLPLRQPLPARKQSTIRTGVLFAILGTFLALTVSVVGVFFYFRKKQEPQPSQADTSTTSATTATSPDSSSGTPATDTPPIAELPPATATTPPVPSNSVHPSAAVPATPPPNTHSTALPTDPVSLAARAIALYNEKNYAEAAALLTQACSGGQADSCDYLGYAYAHKLGVSQDFTRAVSAYQKGCDSGSAAACSHLAAMFQNSTGVGQDSQRARTLYSKACDGGIAEACQTLAHMYQSKVEGGQDLARAATYYGKACNAGNMAGCNSLGSIYQHGQGAEIDLAKALSLYQKACDHNLADGCNNLGYMYQQKVGVERDYTRAAAFYEKACNGGNAFACNNLGIMYQDSEGLTQDYAKAASLYTKACTGGSSNGCSDLGELYRRGLGVAKDAEKARAYLSKGCDMGNQYGCQHMKLID
jgi:TPR repeat protein/serine/threonine protein kinase